MALNEPQRAALDQFRTAVGDGIAAIQAACRDDVPNTSAERLQACRKRFGRCAMRQCWYARP